MPLIRRVQFVDFGLEVGNCENDSTFVRYCLRSQPTVIILNLRDRIIDFIRCRYFVEILIRRLVNPGLDFDLNCPQQNLISAFITER
jgi:hypothetical protein